MPTASQKLLRILPPVLALGALGSVCAWQVTRIESRSQGYEDKSVVLNEICAHNLSGLQDGNGAYGDWIELYNPCGGTIDLSGWTLTDDQEEPARWTFPAGTVLDEYLLLFADGTDTVDSAGYLHTSFSLKTRGETLYLYDTEGELVDHLKYPEQDFDITYGRAFGNGGDSGSFATATPGAANPVDFLNEHREQPLGTAEFSLPAGFYEEPVRVSLTADDPEALIFYTTDGSDPAENGKLYTGPIEVESRAGEANRYVSQATAFGFDMYHDSIWLKNYAYNYAPDPVDKATTITVRLYKDGAWSDQSVAATYWVDVDSHTLPVVSVTADEEDLFGPQGIYMPGSTYFTLLRNGTVDRTGNFLSGEEIGGCVQLFLPDTWESMEASVSVGGLYTRAVARMKNLQVDLKGDAVTTALSEAPEAPALTRFSLKGPGNGVWQYFYQDAFWNNYLYTQGLGTQYNMPVILYLEDEYWGIYCLRERKNTDFFVRHFGVEADSLQTYSYNVTEKSEDILRLEETLYNLPCSDESWAWLQEQFDLEEYTRYLIAHIYANNIDGVRGLGNNMVLWRATEGSSAEYADGRWRFLLNDFDQTLQYEFMNSFDDILNAEATSDNVQKVLFQKLWEYPQYRAAFAEEFRREMATIYAPETLIEAFDAWCEELEPEMERNFARQKAELTPLAPLADRLTDSESTAVDMTLEQWEEERQAVRNFFAQRAEYLLQYLDEFLEQAEA